METALAILILLQTLALVAAFFYFRKTLKTYEKRRAQAVERWEDFRKSTRQEIRELRREIRRCAANDADKIADAIRHLWLFEDLDAWVSLWRIRKSPHRHLHVSYGCMKAGNMTLNATLNGNVSLAETAVSTHFLAPKVFAHRRRMLGMDVLHGRGISRNLEAQLALRAILEEFGFVGNHPQARDAGAPLHVITPLREPVAACLSYLGFLSANYRANNPETPDLDFFKDGFQVSAAHELDPEASPDPLRLMEEWMRVEFAAVFGFNPVSLPFDPEKGYLIHETERVRFLFVRTKNFSQLATILSDFYSVPANRIEVISTNRAEDRNEREQSRYRERVANFKLPEARLQEIYDTPYCQTFFSKTEREDMIRKWREVS